MADETANGAAGAAPEAGNQPQFALQRIYIKDASFEAPNAPQVFQEQGQPELQLNLGQKVAGLGEGVFEVVLTVSLTCTLNGKNAYLAEVQQAGIFTVRGFPEEHLGAILATACPNTLFPFAREAICDLVTKGGFPQLLLAPVNFEILYAQELQRRMAGNNAPQGASH